MWSFLTDLFRRPGSTHTVVVMDGEEVGQTHRYDVRPGRLLYAWGGSLLGALLLGTALIAFTPLRTYIPGYGTEELRRNARLNAIRVAALQDSVAVQQHYIERLQQLLTGQVDSVARTASQSVTPSRRTQEPSTDERTVPEPAASQQDTQAHQQPAVSASSFPVSGPGGSGPRKDNYMRPNLSLPVEAPVETGFPTRNFDAGDAHFGIDLAVSEGTLVRAVGEGYVILADWTQEGGYTVAVQHADGYVSVYKHNKQLLKQTGDRVEAREALAVSGNSGEITTGPHLHFELWRNGLAQDPRPYVTGW